ncbi:MAG: TM2 domain-containing protein [Candidatus Gastranaerophilaceae bacterium]
MDNCELQERKSYTATLFLAFFLGGLGVHRFYTGYILIGLIQLLTLGGLGIWTLIDIISICLGNFKDARGCNLEGYNELLGRIMLVITIVLIISSFTTSIHRVF